MKIIARSLIVAAALGTVIGVGNVARAEPAAEDQSRLIDASLALETAFTEQFINGDIDPEVLSEAVDAVLAAAPEEARPELEEHIGRVIEAGQALATEMTAEERAELAAPAEENVGESEQRMVVGFGGYGAFGMPYYGVGRLGYGYSRGYGLGYGIGYGARYGVGYGVGYGLGYGIGYGRGLGWGWGW